MGKFSRIKIEKEKYNFDKFLPTGSSMLNLLLSNNIYGGFPRKKMVNLIGDSFTGKTFLAWSSFAEMILHNIQIKLCFVESELAFEMDAPNLFGKNIYDHVIWEDNPEHSKMTIPDSKEKFTSSPTIEAFGRQLYKCLIEDKNKYKEPVFYILDSFDSLYSEKEKEEEDAGFIAARRVRVLNERMRKVFPAIHKTNSALIIISQVRTNMDAMFGSKKTRSGGKALKHWATHEIWLSLRKPITNTIRGVKYIVGGEVIAKTTKNRITGFKGDIKFPLNIFYGIDDNRSMIDWLVEFHFWDKKGKNIISDFGDFPMEKLIEHIESKESRIDKLKNIVQKGWNQFQSELANVKSNRKRRYG